MYIATKIKILMVPKHCLEVFLPHIRCNSVLWYIKALVEEREELNCLTPPKWGRRETALLIRTYLNDEYKCVWPIPGVPEDAELLETNYYFNTGMVGFKLRHPSFLETPIGQEYLRITFPWWSKGPLCPWCESKNVTRFDWAGQMDLFEYWTCWDCNHVFVRRL